jgi:hypothetical protein
MRPQRRMVNNSIDLINSALWSERSSTVFTGFPKWRAVIVSAHSIDCVTSGYARGFHVIFENGKVGM